MNKQNIIINKYCGGLGNQMFQYAFGLNLEQQGKRVIVDTSWYDDVKMNGVVFALERVFPRISIDRGDGKVSIFNKQQSFIMKKIQILSRMARCSHKTYFEKKEFIYDEKALHTKKEIVYGYWQCYRYVADVEDQLRRNFVFVFDLIDELEILLEKIENSNAVFLHVRGGDYNSGLYARKLFGNICTAEYYNSAISIMNKKLDNPVFWVFTNDKKYAKSILANMENLYFVSDYVSGLYEDWIDLLMMSKCNHAIIANSSFSWWGAWLIENEDKVIIAPKKWTNKKKNFDICDPHWITI